MSETGQTRDGGGDGRSAVGEDAGGGNSGHGASGGMNSGGGTRAALTALVRRRPIAVSGIAVALAALVMILLVDKPVALFVRDAVQGDWKAFWRDVTAWGKADGWIYLLLALFLGFRGLFLWSAPAAVSRFYARISMMALYVGTSLAVSGLVINLAKFAFGRWRPKEIFRQDAFGFTWFDVYFDANSFPSGHSQVVFAIGMSLALLFPRLAAAFLGVAALIATSRVFVGAHFPSDVLVGSFIGIVSAVLVKRLLFPELTPPRPGDYLGRNAAATPPKADAPA